VTITVLPSEFDFIQPDNEIKRTDYRRVSASENVRAMVMGGKYVGISKFVKKSVVM
jgi:hypothetical protein